jgi:hypothetical protein
LPFTNQEYPPAKRIYAAEACRINLHCVENNNRGGNNLRHDNEKQNKKREYHRYAHDHDTGNCSGVARHHYLKPI